MLISILLENLWADSILLRFVFVIIAIIAFIPLLSGLNLFSVSAFVYCILQRIILSILRVLIPEMPIWLFTAGLIIEVILCIIAIILNIPEGPICVLHGLAFFYETWIISTIVSNIIYREILNFSIWGFIGFLIIASIVLSIISD